MRKEIIGDEIISLLGVSESDDRMLNLFDALGVDKDAFERDEDIGSFWVELEDEMGLELEFNDSISEKYRKPEYIGGQYLVDISFYKNSIFLPYGLKIQDSLEIIEKKLQRDANYIYSEDECILLWIYEDLGEFSIEFENNSYKNIEYISVNLYQDPTIKSKEFILPFKR
jgi:hypothetical protein